MNQFIFCIIFLLSFGSVYSQIEKVDKGTNFLNLTIGIGSIQDYGVDASIVPAFGGSIERVVSEQGPGLLSIGAQAMYQSASAEYRETAISGYNFKSNALQIGARALYYPHLLNFKGVNVYGAVGLSYFSNSRNHSTIGYPTRSVDEVFTIDSELKPTAVLGLRVMLKKSLGLLAEGGYDIAPIKLGISLVF